MEPRTVVLTQDDLALLAANEARKLLSAPSGHMDVHIGWVHKPDSITAVVTIGTDAEETKGAAEKAQRIFRP